MMPSHLQVFPLQLQNEDSDINEADDIRRAAEAYLEALKSGKSGRLKEELRALQGLSSVQAFPAHISQYVSQYYMGLEMFDKAGHLPGHLPCTLWSDKWLFHLSSFDVRAFLTHEWDIYGVTVRPSSIPYAGAGMGCFANQYFGKGEPVGLSYGNFGLPEYGTLSGR